MLSKCLLVTYKTRKMADVIDRFKRQYERTNDNTDYDNLIKELNSNPDLLDTLDDVQIAELEKLLSPYYNPTKMAKKTQKELEESPHLVFSISNRLQDYIYRMALVAAQGYMYQCAAEYASLDVYDPLSFINGKIMKEKEALDKENNHKNDKVKTEFRRSIYERMLEELPKEEREGFHMFDERVSDEYEKHFKDELEILPTDNTVRYRTDCRLAYEAKMKIKQKEVTKFLDRIFEFDPNFYRRRGGYKALATDADRKFANPLTACDDSRKELLRICGEEKTKYILENVVPEDVMQRLRVYTNTNYDDLVKILSEVYGVDNNIEFAINAHEVVPNKQSADNLIENNENRFKFGLMTIPMSEWVLLSPVEGNRERTTYIGSNNSFMKAVVSQFEQDEVIAKDMIEKRVERAHRKNIREHGNHDVSLKEYQETLGHKGDVVHAKYNDDELDTTKKFKRYENDDELGEELEEDEKVEFEKLKEKQEIGTDYAEKYAKQDEEADADCPDNAIQLPVWSANPETGKMERQVIYTEADKESFTM